MLDAFKENTGLDVTLSWNTTRMATSLVRQDGSRETGTEIAADVYQTVKEKGSYFVSDNVIDGQKYYGYYEGLYNSDGSMAGLVFTGMASTSCLLYTSADELSLTPEYFCRLFKKYTGQTFLTYVNQIRLQYFHSDLLQTDESITYLMNKNGITNYKVFLRSFKEAYGMPPGQLRKKQREVRDAGAISARSASSSGRCV